MISIPVNEASQIAESRREASIIAQQNGFNESDTGRVALITTEMATNLIKHGGGGEILAGTYQDEEGKGVEILALDRGRGMANVEACLEDGYSSAGTAGHGLGAVIRQSSFFDIASWPGLGTAVLSRIEAGKSNPGRVPSHSCWGAISVAMTGENVCGDAWTLGNSGTVRTLMVADGLGHGQKAAEASVEAVRVFHRFNGHQLANLLDYIHGGLRSTRGAAVSMARVDLDSGKVGFAGIGNVAGVIFAKGEMKRMVSMPGTAGYKVQKIQHFEYPFDRGLVILHSDGLSTNWAFARYPNLNSAHPTLIAAVLYRDFGRSRDDATVLVGKWV